MPLFFILPVALIGNIGFAAFLLNLHAQFVRVIAFVCDNSLGFRQIYGCYQFGGNADIIDITRRNDDFQRVAASINHQMNEELPLFLRFFVSSSGYINCKQPLGPFTYTTSAQVYVNPFVGWVLTHR